jgi:hypothetical protein
MNKASNNALDRELLRFDLGFRGKIYRKKRIVF